jgi:hypothetical protein
MRSNIAWLIGLLFGVAGLLAPTPAQASTPATVTNCVRLARHPSPLAVHYEWGTATSCRGGWVFTMHRHSALHDTGYAAMPDIIKTQTCDHGFYAHKGKTLFVAKTKAEVRRFRHAYRAITHRHFGHKIAPVKSMRSYQPGSWC